MKCLKNPCTKRNNLAYRSQGIKAESLHSNIDNCREVAQQLKQGATVQPESYSAVTIFLCDIVGFTPLAASMKPIEVSDHMPRVQYIIHTQWTTKNVDILFLTITLANLNRFL